MVPIEPLRGTKQGDLLSPYIFVMCMERLSRLIKEEFLKISESPSKSRTFKSQMCYMLMVFFYLVRLISKHCKL